MEQWKCLNSYCIAVFKSRLDVLLKVKHNLKGLKRSYWQNLNNLVLEFPSTVELYNVKPGISLRYSLRWVDFWMASQNFPDLEQGIWKHFTCILLWKLHYISLWLILLISGYPLYFRTFLTVPHIWIIIYV